MKYSLNALKPYKKTNYGLKTFLWGLLFAFLMFIPFIAYNNGYFLYYGDFNVQQVPFYQMIHDSIRRGNFFWSSTTDLGANIIGSYSFYLIGSPFFWLTLPFPSDAVPYLMGPLLILKFACASWAGYLYINRYVREKNFAVIGGLLYGFSGFSVYNIFFNHFHEAIIIFPILLYAVDEYMINKRRGLLALTVFASCLMNYYFFCGQVVFVVIYWLMNIVCKRFKVTVKEFFLMLFECVVGLAGTAVLLVPTILAVMQNPRVDDPFYGYGALLYGNEQRYLHIIQSMFFPPDIPARPNFTPDSNAKWASIACYLPLFGMCGVIGYMQLQKRDWLKKLISLLLLFAFVPILNGAFQLFNAAYYARWFYMLTLMFSLATMMGLENKEVNWKRAISWSATITVGIALAIGLMPDKETVDNEEITTIGLSAFPVKFWIYVAIAIICILLTIKCVKLLKRNTHFTAKRVIEILGVVAVLYSGFIIFLGASLSYDTHNFVIPSALNGGDELKLDDLAEVRSDFYESMDNMGMYWQIPTIQAFHSIVPGSVMEFYPSVGVDRSVGSRPGTTYYGLRGLTSCKYLFDCNYDDEFFVSEEGKTKMPGWVKLDSQNGFTIYENEYYIPYGFYYDDYITEEDYYNCPESTRHLLLLKAMVLKSEDMVKYADTAKNTATYSDFDYNTASYFSDCTKLQKNACTDFSYDNIGFTATAKVDGERDRLIFFSVPYEPGWSATVNGESAEIVKVNIGFMAVKVPAGQESKIRFTYKTPGLAIGFVITLVATLIYLVYVIICYRSGAVIRTPHRKFKRYRVIDASNKYAEHFNLIEVETDSNNEEE